MTGVSDCVRRNLIVGLPLVRNTLKLALKTISRAVDSCHPRCFKGSTSPTQPIRGTVRRRRFLSSRQLRWAEVVGRLGWSGHGHYRLRPESGSSRTLLRRIPDSRCTSQGYRHAPPRVILSGLHGFPTVRPRPSFMIARSRRACASSAREWQITYVAPIRRATTSSTLMSLRRPALPASPPAGPLGRRQSPLPRHHRPTPAPRTPPLTSREGARLPGSHPYRCTC